MAPSPADLEETRTWAQFYRRRGWNPLPSRMDEKRPFVSYSDLWAKPTDPKLFEQFPTTNIQLMCGRHWRLLILDLDGPEAREWFFSQKLKIPRTWATSSGGNGVHVWLRFLGHLSRPLPKAVLWRGVGRHSAVERLCDHSLVVVPPSIHPVTGRRYRFVQDPARGFLPPTKLSLPGVCPPQILALPSIEEQERDKLGPVELPPRPPRIVPVSTGAVFHTLDVVDAIPARDKIALARSWGMRFHSEQPNAKGWCRVHAIDRPDRHPSGSFHAAAGIYWESGRPRASSFFNLAVELGVYGTWQDAVTDLATRYHVRPRPR